MQVVYTLTPLELNTRPICGSLRWEEKHISPVRCCVCWFTALLKACYKALSAEGSNATASSLLRAKPLFQPASRQDAPPALLFLRAPPRVPLGRRLGLGTAPAWTCTPARHSPGGSSGLEARLAPESRTGGTEKALPRSSPSLKGLMP